MDAQSAKKATRITLFSIFGSLLLAVIKLIAGFLGNSFALVADGIESSADIVSSLLVLFGIRYSAMPADENHPYGHGKIEPIITFIVVAFLIVSAGFIIWQSAYNIQNSHEMPEPWTLYVLGLIVLWKEVSYRVVMRRAKQLNSSVLKADAWHHRSDAITSVAAFVGIALALYLGEGYEVLDDWAAIVASGFILYNAYHIFRPALSEVMDEHVYPEQETRIRNIAEQVSGIENTEKCYIRKAGMVYHLELHARVDGNMSVRVGHDISHKLKDTLKNQMPELGNVVIHIEPN